MKALQQYEEHPQRVGKIFIQFVSLSSIGIAKHSEEQSGPILFLLMVVKVILCGPNGTSTNIQKKWCA